MTVRQFCGAKDAPDPAKGPWVRAISFSPRSASPQKAYVRGRLAAIGLTQPQWCVLHQVLHSEKQRMMRNAGGGIASA